MSYLQTQHMYIRTKISLWFWDSTLGKTTTYFKIMSKFCLWDWTQGKLTRTCWSLLLTVYRRLLRNNTSCRYYDWYINTQAWDGRHMTTVSQRVAIRNAVNRYTLTFQSACKRRSTLNQQTTVLFQEIVNVYSFTHIQQQYKRQNME